jgi:hypothetical protein
LLAERSDDKAISASKQLRELVAFHQWSTFFPQKLSWTLVTSRAEKHIVSVDVMVKMGRGKKKKKKHPTFFGGHAPFCHYKNGCFMYDSHLHGFLFSSSILLLG